jgi:hypothetical protein
MNKLSNIEILLSDARGIYIPRDFFLGFDLEKWHLKAEDLTALNDPENENYWYVWDHVLNNAYCILNGKKYTLWQDGDLWAMAFDHLSDDEKENFGFDDF